MLSHYGKLVIRKKSKVNVSPLHNFMVFLLNKDKDFHIFGEKLVFRFSFSKNMTKVSFFWDQSQDMSSSSFPQKKTGFWLADLSGLPLRGLFIWWEDAWTHVLTLISDKTYFSSLSMEMVYLSARWWDAGWFWQWWY